MGYFIQGALSFANILIALFVLFFAASFLKRTKDTKEKHPWIFLFIAVIIFFCLQIIKVLELLGQVTIGDYMFYLDSMFIAIVLFTFIFQYNLILNSELLQIRRKEKALEASKQVTKTLSKRAKSKKKPSKKR